MNDFEYNNDFKSIREFLGKDISKLYTFMDKSRLVQADTTKCIQIYTSSKIKNIHININI